MYYVIVNPASKSGRGRQIWIKLERIFEDNNIPYKVVFSKEAGHVERVVSKLTAPLAEDPDAAPIKLIILGGDGTMNEALQGIHDFDRVWLGYIPTGSSNDLARDLQLPKEPETILSSILEGKIVRTMDFGTLIYDNGPGERSALSTEPVADTRHFCVSSGIGFDAAVCENALSSSFKSTLNKFGLGKLIYLSIALKQLINAQYNPCDIYLDNSTEPIHFDRFLFTSFMIHKYEGGGFKFCPTADATDGMLDLCVIGNIPKWLIPFALPTAYYGKHYIFPQLKHYRATKARIITSSPLWVHTDGEVYAKADSLTITCTSQKVNMMM